MMLRPLRTMVLVPMRLFLVASTKQHPITIQLQQQMMVRASLKEHSHAQETSTMMGFWLLPICCSSYRCSACHVTKGSAKIKVSGEHIEIQLLHLNWRI